MIILLFSRLKVQHRPHWTEINKLTELHFILALLKSVTLPFLPSRSHLYSWVHGIFIFKIIFKGSNSRSSLFYMTISLVLSSVSFSFLSHVIKLVPSSSKIISPLMVIHSLEISTFNSNIYRFQGLGCGHLFRLFSAISQYVIIYSKIW